jgi:type IV secretory pathway VirJ component
MTRADRWRLGLVGLASSVAAAAVAPMLLPPFVADAARAAAPGPQPAASLIITDAPYRLAQVGTVSSFRPSGPIKGVAVFLSGDGGWNLGVVGMAQALTRQGIAVAGVSTPAFLKALEAGRDSCINPNSALAELAQDFEHRLGLPDYVKPILVGYSSGATVAYAALAQAPGGTWRGAVSLGFGPDLPGRKPWCASPNLSATAITRPDTGWLFAPASRLAAPWLVLQGLSDQVVSADVTRSFTARVPQAKLIELPKVGHGFSVQANWMPQFLAAFRPMLAQEAAATHDDTRLASISDLPLTTVADPAAPRTSLMAVLYSGDGGWAGIDRDVAAALAGHGVPVAGIDSLSYFWRARTPRGSALDLARVIDHFSNAWGRPRVVLVGYSFGADTLPAIVGQLPSAERAHVVRVSMAGLSGSADFQFHLSNWVDMASASAIPTLPAVAALKGLDMQCIHGTDDKDSICPSLPSGLAEVIALPGGHHFKGDADLVARTVLRGLTTT